MTSKTLLLLAVATCGVGGVASAQVQEVPLAPNVEARTIDVQGNPVSGYSQRAIGIVFDNGFSTAGGASDNGVAVGTTHFLENFDLTGGPMASLAIKRVTGLGFNVQSAGCTGSQTYDVLLEYFAGASCDYTAANMLSSGGVDAAPIAAFRIGPITQNCGFQTYYTVNLIPNGIGGANDTSFLLPANQGFVRCRIVETGTTTLRPYASAGTGTQIQAPVFARGLGANAVGIITSDYGRDIDGNGTNLALPYAGGAAGLLGGAPVITGGAAGAHEHRQTSATITTSWKMKLDGDLTCTAPGSVTNLGNLANGLTLVDTTIAAGETKWYSFNVGAATDALQTFLDLDCEGSAVTDLTMALYDSQGARISFDTEDGSGLLPQLTYGVCRRGASGDGRDYDGRDGQLTNPGTYYVAVGGSATSFQSCFGVNNTSTETGAVRIRLNTNASVSGSIPPGAPTPPSVEQDFGSIVAPGFQTAEIAAGPLNVTWYRFTLTAGTDATNYLDLDTGFTANPGTDTEMAVYDAAGNLVATDDDDSISFHSALSFGAPGSPRPATGDGLPFDGRDGNLGAGTYFAVVGLFNLTPGAGSWCAHTNSGSNLGVTLTVTTNSTGIDVCCRNDYNGDGDVGTDLDIENFFSCLSGTCCGTCPPNADFNCDGDVGTDGDIEAFFRVLGGGAC